MHVPIGHNSNEYYVESTDWLREQLELLADEVRFGSLNATPEQMSRLIGNIAKGYDWREGAWK